MKSLVAHELARFDAEEQDMAGDGFFATFDGAARGICARTIVKSAREGSRSGPAWTPASAS
jgi:hypothetical protein